MEVRGGAEEQWRWDDRLARHRKRRSSLLVRLGGSDVPMRCAVIGGGIIGAFCAYYLLKRGHSVVVYDRFDSLFQGTTAAAFGSLTPYSDPFFSGALSRFAQSSVSLYRTEVVPHLTASGRIDISEDSLIHIFDTVYDLEESHLKLKEKGYVFDVDYRILDREKIQQLEPNLRANINGGIEYSEPWIDAQQLLTVLGDYLRTHERCAFRLGREVTAVRSRPGAASVATRSAPMEEFDGVILASGPSACQIDGLVKPRLKLIRGDGALAVTGDGQPLVQRHVYWNDAFITPRRNGEHLLGATYDESPLGSGDDRSSADRAGVKAENLRNILSGCFELVPALANCEITKLWHGFRASTPSGAPYVGLLPGQDRIWGALGFIGLGLTLAPAVGLGLAAAFDGDLDAIPADFSAQQPDLWEASA